MIIDIFIESGMFRSEELQLLNMAYYNKFYDFQKLTNIRKTQYQQNEIYVKGMEYATELIHPTYDKICSFCLHSKSKMYHPITKENMCSTCLFTFTVPEVHVFRNYEIEECHLTRLNRFQYKHNNKIITLYQLQDIEDIKDILYSSKLKNDEKEMRYNQLLQLGIQLNIKPHRLVHLRSSFSDINTFYHSNDPCFDKIKEIFSLWKVYEEQISTFSSLKFSTILMKFMNYIHNPDKTIDNLRHINQIEYDKQSRRRELEEALATEGLVFRVDSKLCHKYIEEPNSEFSLKYIVSMMKEMEWFHFNTSYRTDLIKAIQYHAYHRNSYNIHHVSKLIKKRLIQNRIERKQDVPDFIQERYMSTHS